MMAWTPEPDAPPRELTDDERAVDCTYEFPAAAPAGLIKLGKAVADLETRLNERMDEAFARHWERILALEQWREQAEGKFEHVNEKFTDYDDKIKTLAFNISGEDPDHKAAEQKAIEEAEEEARRRKAEKEREEAEKDEATRMAEAALAKKRAEEEEVMLKMREEALAAKRDMDEMRRRREERRNAWLMSAASGRVAPAGDAPSRALAHFASPRPAPVCEQEERIAELRAQGEKQALEAMEKQKADMAAMMAKMNEDMEREKAGRALEAKRRMDELEAKAKAAREELEKSQRDAEEASVDQLRKLSMAGNSEDKQRYQAALWRNGADQDLRQRARRRWKLVMQQTLMMERLSKMRKSMLSAKVDKKETMAARLDRVEREFRQFESSAKARLKGMEKAFGGGFQETIREQIGQTCERLGHLLRQQYATSRDAIALANGGRAAVTSGCAARGHRTQQHRCDGNASSGAAPACAPRSDRAAADCARGREPQPKRPIQDADASATGESARPRARSQGGQRGRDDLWQAGSASDMGVSGG